MRETVTITPSAIVVIRDVFRYHPLPHILKIHQQTRLELNGGHPSRGAGHEYGHGAAIQFGERYFMLYLRCDINNVTIPSGLKTDLLGHNHLSHLLKSSYFFFKKTGFSSLFGASKRG
jgi:hypothetical protein